MGSRELPEELIIIILSKLPVRSLLQFKCVRKSWYSLIKSPHFIDLHFQNRSSSSSNSSKYDCFIVRRFLEQHHNRHVLSFYSYETLDDFSIDIDTPFSKREDIVLVSGPCNGLICITNNKYNQIVVCNPAIREFKSLVVPPKLGHDKIMYDTDSVAIGFDPNTTAYKVVRIVRHLHEDWCVRPIDIRKAEVYNFSTDSWRDTDAVFPTAMIFPYNQTSLNGAFHWDVLCDLEGEWIFSFHISNEVTRWIPLPDSCSLLDNRCRDPYVLNESLALIVYDNSYQMEKHYEIWVMTEYGVKESWTMRFKLGPLFGITFPLAFWKKNELILETNNGHLVSYDLQHQNIKHFPIYGAPTHPGLVPSFGVLAYSESLVSVNAINEKGESA